MRLYEVTEDILRGLKKDLNPEEEAKKAEL
jgi:hypothetical protein